MNCKIYREQIIENINSLSCEAKIHIKDCPKCRKLWNEYANFEKFMDTTKKNLLLNTQTTLQPQYVVNLAFIKKEIQKNLSSMKRLYIYATVLLITFIYTIIFNTFVNIGQNTTTKTTNTAITTTLENNAQEVVQGDNEEDDAEFFSELDKSEEMFVKEILDFIDECI